MTEGKKRRSKEISRREFLRDAGLLVGGTAIGSSVLLAACTTKTETVTDTVTQTNTATVTSTSPGETITSTATTTLPGTTATSTTTATATQEVSKFVCPSCGMEFDTLAELQAHFEDLHGEATLEELHIVTLTVNGTSYEIQVEPNWTLAEVLRNKLGLTGSKIGCNEGACGACTVLINGKPVPSCLILAIEAEGKAIETIEGVSLGPLLHPIQDAWLEEHGTQCGFCTPGMIMSTKALLDRNPDPSIFDIKEALGGNICNCGNYEHIIKSVLSAAGKIGGR
jgi:carbon-monoxide dehydrogenase small subunit